MEGGAPKSDTLSLEIVGVITVLVFASFLFGLRKKLLLEEALVLFFLPYFLLAPVVGVSCGIRKLGRKGGSFRGFLVGVLVPAAPLQILLVAGITWFTSPAYYGKKDVVSDLDDMVRMLEDVHPDPYEQISKERFYAEVQAAREKPPNRVEEKAVYREVARLLSLIGDAHTRIGRHDFTKRGIWFRWVFPYKIKIQGDRIYVIGNYSFKDALPVGSELLKINGLSPAGFTAEVSRLLSYETIAFRNEQLEDDPSIISAWNDYRDYDIEYSAPGSRAPKRIRTKGGAFAAIRRVREVMKISAGGPRYEFKTLSNDVGYIGFYECRDGGAFAGFLRSTFAEIKQRGLRSLIIDIRANGGGDSRLAGELMQYISKKPFRLFEWGSFKISNELLSRHALDMFPPALRTPGKVIKLPHALTALRENRWRFDGNCFLLTSGRTCSAAVVLASAFQCFGVGTVVGTETGGATVCYGEFHFVTLPRTGIDFVVSSQKTCYAGGTENRRGVLPDYVVENSLDDERNHNDKVLQFTLELIRKQPSSKRRKKRGCIH
jgi:hypothetical protein